MKLKKGKLFIYTTISLSVIALITLGFSSWILDGSINDSSQVIANVGMIEDNTIVAEISDDSDFSIRFDNVSNPENGNVTNNDNQVQDMEFTLIYTLTSPTQAINNKNFGVNVEISFSNDSNVYSELNSKGYVDTSCLTSYSINNLPTENSNNYDEGIENVETTITYSNYNNISNSRVTISSKYIFKWGSTFNNDNPGNYNGIDLATKLVDFQKTLQNSPQIILTVNPINNRSN